jgi:hypothetical protein
MINSNPTLDGYWYRSSIVVHGFYHVDASLLLFHEGCTKQSFTTDSVTGTVDIQVNFIVAILLYQFCRLGGIFGVPASNLTHDWVHPAVITQVFVDIIRVDQGFIHHHFGPQDTSFRKDSKELMKFGSGNVKHGSNVEKLVFIVGGS